MGHAPLASAALAALALAVAAPALAEGPAHEFVTSWGSLGASGEGRFSGPSSLDVDHVGSVYVADTGNGRIQKFNNLGGFEGAWGGLGNSTGSLSTPMGVAVMDGRVYVVDSVLEEVVVYGLDGEYMSRWGGHGGDPGEFLQPRGIAARNGTVYVADTGNSRVQAFTPSGTHLLTFGNDRDEAALLRSPVGVAVAPDSSVFVSDPGTMAMMQYAANGTLIGHFDGTVAGKSLRPRGIAADGEGKIYVADTRNDRVLRIEPSGMTLSAWGSSGNGAYKYLMPTDVAVDLYGQLFVIDSGGHSVKKYTSPLALADSERAAARAAAEERFRQSQEPPAAAPPPAAAAPPPASAPAPAAAQPAASPPAQRAPVAGATQPPAPAHVASATPPTPAPVASATPPPAATPPVASATPPVRHPAPAQQARVVAVPGDLTKPTIYAPHDVYAEAAGPLTRIDVGMATASDESGIRSITSNAPAEFSLGTSLVIWTAIDNAGNLAIARQQVTVSDTTPPFMEDVADITVEAVSPERNYIEIRAPTANDAVGVLDVTSDAPAYYGVGDTTITWTARDISGNSAHEAQVVSVVDTTAPQIIAPADILAEATSASATTVFLGDASVVDNGKIVSVTSDAPPAFALGNTTVTWTAADSFGNSAQDEQLVTIVDTTAPVIGAPAEVVIEAESAGSNAAELDEPAVSDVQETTIESDAPAEFGMGETTVTWTVVDASGNSSTATQAVRVVDTTAPEIGVTGVITQEATDAEGNEVELGDVTVTDVSEIASLTSDAPGSYPVGETVVTWTATDAHGNSATATQTVQIIDTTRPSVFAPADVTVEHAGAGGNTVDLGDAVAADRVGVDSVTNDAPETFGLGETVVTWKATDTSGNESTSEQVITVVDTLEPAISAPPDVSAEASSPSGTRVETGTATAADESGDVEVTSDAPEEFPIGETTITWTATDPSGNSVSATQLVTVTDTTRPEILAPADIEREASSEETAVELGEATASDAVGPVTVTSDAPAAFPVGETAVTWTATDAAGNSASGTQKVVITDTVAPAVTAPADITAEAGSGIGDIGEATATDAVGVASLESDAPEEFGPGETTITWTATDAAGNSASDSHTVTIIDTTRPHIVAPADLVVEAASAGGAVTDIGLPTHSDAGGGVEIASDAPETFPIGTTTVTWTATDAAGNSSVAEQEVTVSDTIPPSLTAPPAATAEAASANYTKVDIGEATAEDAVGVAAVTSDAPEAFALGITTVTWTATDAAGNESTAEQEVAVSDTVAPELVAPGDIVAEAASSGPTPVEVGMPAVTDAVGVEEVTSDAPEAFAIGETTITWTATDAAGNSATAEQIVTVVDTVAPVVIPPADVTFEATSPEGAVGVIGVAGAEDSVGAVEVTSDAPERFPVGETTVTWSASDAAGNEHTATQLITVRDTTAPTLVVPADIAAEAGSRNGTAVALGNATATDIVGVIEISNDAPALFGPGVTVVRWKAADAAGNTAVGLQTVTLGDGAAPLLAAPADMTVNATGLLTPVALGVPAVTDTVDASPVITSDSPGSFGLGTTTVTWNATDASGNRSSAAQSVTVLACGLPHTEYNVIRGTEGDDSLSGTAGADLVFGMGGNDVVTAGAGGDCVLAGAGDDVLLGGAGDDTLDGGAGDDIVRGQAGDDTLDGGAGSDVIDGGEGSDSCSASEGDSALRCEA